MGQIFDVIPFIQLTHVQNPGAAFGLFGSQKFFLIAIGIIVLVMVTLYKQKRHNIPPSLDCGLAFLIGGNLGNLFDRIFHGFVIDFIKLPHWPTFNIADISINIGIGLIILYLFLSEENNQKEEILLNNGSN